jgi:hypothetical protein
VTLRNLEFALRTDGDILGREVSAPKEMEESMLKKQLISNTEEVRQEKPKPKVEDRKENIVV